MDTFFDFSVWSMKNVYVNPVNVTFGMGLQCILPKQVLDKIDKHWMLKPHQGKSLPIWSILIKERDFGEPGSDDKHNAYATFLLEYIKDTVYTRLMPEASCSLMLLNGIHQLNRYIGTKSKVYLDSIHMVMVDHWSACHKLFSKALLSGY